MFMNVVMPTGLPDELSITVNGSIAPSLCSFSRRSISSAIHSGCGTVRVPQLPQLAVGNRFAQVVVMAAIERRQRNARALQRNRLQPVHDGDS